MRSHMLVLAALFAVFLSSGCVTPAVRDAVDQGAQVLEKNYREGSSAGDEQTGLAAQVLRAAQHPALVGAPAETPSIEPDALKETVKELVADASLITRIKGFWRGLADKYIPHFAAGAGVLGLLAGAWRKLKKLRGGGVRLVGTVQTMKHGLEGLVKAFKAKEITTKELLAELRKLATEAKKLGDEGAPFAKDVKSLYDEMNAAASPAG